MKIVKIIGVVLLALILLFVIVGLALPSEYTVTRTVEIDAEPADIHALVGDLERWPEFMPWQDHDPSLEVTIDEPTGTGAHQTWTGDSGDGVLTFTASDPATGIAYDMVIDENFESDATISYADAGDGTTRVTWEMQGDMAVPIVGGYFALAADSMMGPMFVEGLEKLKAVAEAAEPTAESGDEPADDGE